MEQKKTELIEKELLNVKEVSKMLGVGNSTIYNFIYSGKLPKPIRLGGSIKWRKREMEDWIDAGCPPRVRWKWKPKKR